ncbi:MAG: hypothetical protein ACSLFQ_06730 [Thermoanaerobaculia bacterium]
MRRNFTKTTSLLAGALMVVGTLALSAVAQSAPEQDSNAKATQKKAGPADGTGNQGVGPKDGTGYGAPTNAAAVSDKNAQASGTQAKKGQAGGTQAKNGKKSSNGPGDGTGNKGNGPKDGSGYGAGSGKKGAGSCTGTGPQGSGGGNGRRGGRG